MTKRGDVVILDFPFTDLPQSKPRPAVVVQNDQDNLRMRKTIVAMVTGNLRRRGDPSHFLIDPAALGGATSGLHGPSLVSCINLYTVEQSDIIATVGHLSAAHEQQLNDCLRAALAIT